MRLELHEIEPRPRDPGLYPLSAIRVTLDAASRQTGGLSFAFEFENTGSAPVAFEKPDDSMQIEMLDAAGYPVEIPRPIPPGLRDVRREPGTTGNQPDEIVLKPGKRYRTALNAGERKSSAPPRTSPLMPGSYRIRIKVLLLSSDPGLKGDRSSRVLESDRFLVELEK
jgi:hypothetical protein